MIQALTHSRSIRAAGAALAIFALSACTVGNELPGAGVNTIPAGDARADNSMNSVDWSGAYEGTLPCPDCAGLQLRLQLNRDSTFALTTTFLGKPDAPFTQRGRFRWNDAGSQVELLGLGDAPSRYLVGEGQITQLDTQGQRVLGALAYRYVLRKETGLTEQQEIDQRITQLTAPLEWRLVELRGAPVSATNAGAEIPSMRFERDQLRLTGSTGCNSYAGNFEVNTGNRIRIGQLVMTERACVGPNLETEFTQILGTVDNFNVSATMLVLNRARMAPLARFEAVAR